MPLARLFFILLFNGLPPLDIFFVNQSQGFHPTVPLLFGIHTKEEPRFTNRSLPPVNAEATVLWDFYGLLKNKNLLLLYFVMNAWKGLEFFLASNPFSYFTNSSHSSTSAIASNESLPTSMNIIFSLSLVMKTSPGSKLPSG
jgi:hypothetical protein